MHGSANSSARPGQISGWGSRAQSPVKLQKSGILRYKIQPKNSTSWFSFLAQNEVKRKNRPSDMPYEANDTFAQI